MTHETRKKVLLQDRAVNTIRVDYVNQKIEWCAKLHELST